MSQIDYLIGKLCPNGVDFKTVGEVASYIRGVTYSKEDEQSEGLIRVLRSNNITLSSNKLNFEDVKHVSASVRVRVDQHLYAHDILISAASGSKAHVGKVAYIWENLDYVFGGFMAVLRVSCHIEPRFLFHLLVGSTFSDYLANTLSTSTINNLSSSVVSAFRIPVPPIEVQQEIVQMLDLFTTVEAELAVELEAELDARRLEYSFYRDRLLKFPKAGGVRWVTMPDIAINLDSRRKPVTKAARKAGEYPYYGASGVVDRVSDFIFDGDYLLVSEDGANLLARSTPVAFSISGKTWVNNHAHILEFGSYAGRRFIEIYLNSIDLRPYVTSGPQPKLNQAHLNKIPLPCPPLEEQERIVGILDKCEALVDELNAALTTELSARCQQYEYYRDKLLTFEEAVA